MRCVICNYCSSTKENLVTDLDVPYELGSNKRHWKDYEGHANLKTKRANVDRQVVRIDELTGDPICSHCMLSIRYSLNEFSIDNEEQNEYSLLEDENAEDEEGPGRKGIG